MPSEAVSDGIFYFGARFGFPFSLPRIVAYCREPDGGGKFGAEEISIIIMRIN